MRTFVDITDPFGNWQRKKTLFQIAQCRPPRHHKWLREHPPTHCLVKGQIAVVGEYLDECLWWVTIHQQPLIIHELDAQLLSKEWILEQI